MIASLSALAESLDSALDRFQSLDGRFVAVALGFQLANLALRSLVWRNVLAAAYPDRRVPLLSVAGAYAAGAALNSFTPARGGELAKAVLARARIPGSALSTIAATMGVVAAFDAVLGGALIGVAWSLGLVPSLPSLPSVPLEAGAIPVAAAGVAVFVARPLAARLRGLWLHVRQGLAILGDPRRYVATVVPLQLAAWTCRVSVVYFLLAAFRIDAGIAGAALVVVLGGLSTAVPVPGGGGAQQVLAAYALQQTVSTAAAVSFSVGMQVGITVVNTLIGLAAAMLMFRTLHPGAAVRSGLALVRAARR